MTQDQLIILMLKVVLVAAEACTAGFIAVYWRLAPWYRNPIGRTIVVKDMLLIGALLPSILSLFLNFNRLTSVVAAWADIGFFFLISPVMIWRSAVFIRIHRHGDRSEPDQADAAGRQDEPAGA